MHSFYGKACASMAKRIYRSYGTLPISSLATEGLTVKISSGNNNKSSNTSLVFKSIVTYKEFVDGLVPAKLSLGAK